MSADEILLSVGLTVALAVGTQILASRLRIPSLIVLLPAGRSVRPARASASTYMNVHSAEDGDTLILLGPASATGTDPAG